MDFWHWPGVGTCGENNLKLKINEACLQVFSYANSTIKLKSQTPECFGVRIIKFNNKIATTKTYYFPVRFY